MAKNYNRRSGGGNSNRGVSSAPQEQGAVVADWGGRIPVALTMPNTYYVGMSSLALQLLYSAFNREPDVVCERIFWEKVATGAPDTDLKPPVSIESGRPAGDFGIWAFTISWEMDYFNVVELLRRSGIPPLASERSDSRQWNGEPWPLLIAGGPGVTMNPEPMAPFFDAILIGEGEEALPEFLDLCRDAFYEDRSALLARLDEMRGWYVPALRPSNLLHSQFRPVERLWVRNLPEFDTSSTLYTAETEFANMHLMEIARGCGRGCRFCLAGYVYRPAREQPLDSLLSSAELALAQGHERVGLVSAAVSDHTQIDELATELEKMGAQISASSMRMDPISVPLIRAMARTGARNLTVAPEAGSQRLRNVINKTQTEDQMMEAISLAQEFDFPQLKLYFMIGHPTETADDIQALIDFTLTARERFRRRIAINATPFVPKAHTPFQWEGMTPPDELRRRQKRIHRALVRHGVEIRADSPEWAEVQAVLSRGDRRLAEVLLAIPAGGLTVKRFFATMAECGLEKEQYTGPQTKGSPLPWDVVQSGVSQNYFEYELRLAKRNETGLSCPPDSAGCLSCQACDVAWAFRYGDNASRPVPSAKGGPWRAQDWRPWSHLRQKEQEHALP